MNESPYHTEGIGNLKGIAFLTINVMKRWPVNPPSGNRHNKYLKPISEGIFTHPDLTLT